MDKVEKVARAIYEARGAHEPPRAWRKWEDIGDEARAVWCQCATAALAAMGEREGVGEASVRPQFLATEDGEFNGNTHASPRPEAVGEAVKAEMAQPTNEKGAG